MMHSRDDDLITQEQAVAARILLNRTALEIARALAVTAPAVRRAVVKGRSSQINPRLAVRLRSYFEGCGVEFLPAGEVRLKEVPEVPGDPTAAEYEGQDAAVSGAGPQVTAAQLRAARRLLQWPQAEVAKANGWKAHRISDLETGPRFRPEVGETLKKFYESVGIVFLADGQVQIDKSDE